MVIYLNVSGDILRGHTDAIILSILKEGDNYGYQINLEISSRSNGFFMLSEATLYTAFKRLMQDALITSYWKDGLYVKRKFYSITDSGLKYLEDQMKSWNHTKTIIDQFIGGKKNEG
jgi:PadR family transcriptional regulator, regulatory protein PadR